MRQNPVSQHPHIWYFGAGPAMLPDVVLDKARAALVDWQNTGLSILEVHHRSDVFQSLLLETQQLLRDLLHIPPDYHIVFLGCPARAVFSMLPLHFGDGFYYITGHWSQKAYCEAQKLSQPGCQIIEGASVPLHTDVWQRNYPANIRYCYYTPNETIEGISAKKPAVPDGMPLIADMTSCLLTEPIRITDYQLIFSGAQKNIGAAGMTVLIVQDAFLKTVTHTLPSAFDLREHVAHASCFATPPVFNIYLAHSMLCWMIQQGGLDVLYRNNQKKARVLYDYIDNSIHLLNHVCPENRSIMNVCFHLQEPENQDRLIQYLATHGLSGLCGHRAAGGLRASLYNPMPLIAVQSLVQHMDEFFS